MTVAGTDVSLAQLNNAGTAPVAITTAKGVLTITGYNTLTGVLTYNYDPAGTSKDHSSGANSVFDTVAVSVTESGGNIASGTLTVLITDSVPLASADTEQVAEGTTSATTAVTGNVIAGRVSEEADNTGADTPISVVGVAATNTASSLADTSTVNADIGGNYGKINIAVDGSYVYTLDNVLPAVQALNAGDTLTDTFTYTIKDSDGSLSFTTVTITINGVTDTPSIAVNDVIVNEGAGSLTFTVNRSGNTSLASSVSYATAKDGLQKSAQ